MDGQFLPAKPQEMLAAGNYKTDVKLLASTVEDEGSFIAALSAPQFRPISPEPLSLEQAKQFLFQFASHAGKREVDEKLLVDYYFSGLNQNYHSQDTFRRRVGIAMGDAILGCPTIEFAKQIYNHSKTATAFQWFYKAKLGDPVKLACHAPYAGTCHTDDLFPAFGIPFRFPEKHTNRERDISNEVNLKDQKNMCSNTKD